jgi:hypothetical protein
MKPLHSTLIVLLVGCILVISGCTSQGGSLGDCDRMEDQLKKNQCYEQIAIDEGNPDICTKVRGNLMTEQCYIKVAAGNGDKEICDNIPEASSISISKCYREVAQSTNDLSLCEKIEVEVLRERCIEDINS